MSRATERQQRQGWKRVGMARSALALVMAALTGCYHTASVTRIPHDRVKKVERVPDGTQLQLRALEVEPGVVAVTAEEQAMCRDLEQGARSWSIQTIEAKHFFGRNPGDVRGSSAPVAGSEDASSRDRSEDAPTKESRGLPEPVKNIAFAVVCVATLPICFAVLVVGGLISAAFWLVAIPVWFLLPDEKVSEEPSRERPVPYREWRSEQVSCGQPARVLSDIPFRIIARLNQAQCLEWRTVTATGGTPSRLPSLERTQASVFPCDQPVATGCVWIEPVGDVAELPERSEQPAASRTLGALIRTLTPTEADALGLAGPPSGKMCRTGIGASPVLLKDVVAVQACASTLAPSCRSKLDACLAGPDAFCWSSVLRCQPRTPEFASCMVANMMPYEDASAQQGR